MDVCRIQYSKNKTACHNTLFPYYYYFFFSSPLKSAGDRPAAIRRSVWNSSVSYGCWKYSLLFPPTTAIRDSFRLNVMGKHRPCRQQHRILTGNNFLKKKNLDFLFLKYCIIQRDSSYFRRRNKTKKNHYITNNTWTVYDWC